ncbi:MAG: peptide deformylase [Acidobacteria bacterium]|nr:MAG: peptide deformylase [Acidobacteriota bacterium]
MLLKLLQVGEPVLRDRARPLSSEEIISDPIQELISSMRDTLRDAPGVGLAAPQVGLPIQLAIIEDPPEYWTELSASELAARERTAVPFHIIINPRITFAGEPSLEFFEGCLSLSGFTALVPRSREITVECLDERAEMKTIRASGWYARILQHEIDHLNGTIYIDRMRTRSFMSLDNYKRNWKSESLEEIRKKFSN